MLKPNLIRFAQKRNGNILKQKDTVLLAKHEEKYYRVQEYIGLIVKIYPKMTYSSEIPLVRVRFQNSQEFDINAYLDNDITENCFVSIYGIVVPEKDNQLKFLCKGGMVRAYDTIMQAGRVNTKNLSRFGILELSEIKESARYSSNLTGIEVLEKNRLWIYSGTNIKEAEENSRVMIEEEDFTIDVSKGQNFFINSQDGSVSI